MMATKNGRSTVCIWMALALAISAGGCTGLRSAGGGGGGERNIGESPLYYGFPDVLIPAELREDKQNSYLVQSQGFSAGILAFRGRVDRGSLIAFFRENMAKDNWRTIGGFTASRSILLFHKENRWCVINIAEGDFSTAVEVGVVPTTANATVTPRVEEGMVQ
ncbi:MAG: hypothetical protein ACLFPR_15115 [Desulfococcaceae bacterium]